MLRSDEIGVALFPDRLLIARVGGGWRRIFKQREVIQLAAAAAGAPAWQPAVEALAGKVMDGALSHANVSLVLSSHFVHYTLVPWSELLRSEAEQVSYARQRFVRVHGESAEGWEIRLSRAGSQKARVACGIPQTLIEALNEVMSPIGRRYRSLQPHLMASFNRWRSKLGARPGWFSVVEPGLTCLALLENGKWQSLRAVKLHANWAEQLPEILAREQCLADDQPGIDLVSVFSPDLPAAAALEKGPWKVDDLQPALERGKAPSADAAFAVLVGV